jgi:hypothetical protein
MNRLVSANVIAVPHGREVDLDVDLDGVGGLGLGEPGVPAVVDDVTAAAPRRVVVGVRRPAHDRASIQRIGSQWPDTFEGAPAFVAPGLSASSAVSTRVQVGTTSDRTHAVVSTLVGERLGEVVGGERTHDQTAFRVKRSMTGAEAAGRAF